MSALVAAGSAGVAGASLFVGAVAARVIVGLGGGASSVVMIALVVATMTVLSGLMVGPVIARLRHLCLAEHLPARTPEKRTDR